MTAERLVESPVFILAPGRSGSTLLRSILNSHSQICSPHELHLPEIKVSLTSWHLELSMTTLGFDESSLEFLLWDRILHHVLTTAGKSIVVEKTPANVFKWKQITECWAGARYLFLRRHPVYIAESMHAIVPDQDRNEVDAFVAKYVTALEEARANLDGLTVRYEELTTRPSEVTARICDFLGVAWEESMLDYGKSLQGPYELGIGDWGDNIKSGEIVKAREGPDAAEIPLALQAACRAWGYLDG